MMHRWTMEQANAFALIGLSLLITMCSKKTNPVVAEEIIETPPPTYFWVPVQTKVNDAFGGYYVAMPPDYYDSQKEYPMILFLHGLGQAGNGTTELPYINFDGIGKLINENKFPLYFIHNDEKYSFVVVSPQSNRAPTPDEIKHFAEYISVTYRVDKNRFYLSGLSMGARCVTLAAAKYPHFFAAAVPIAGVADNTGMEERSRVIAEAGLPLWLFHNSDDPMSNVEDARRFVELINANDPIAPAIYTEFKVYGHDAWTTALDTSYKENGRNIYEWMLQYSRD